MSISAMKQALQALELIDKDIEWHDKSPTRKFCNQAAHFLRQAIAEAEKQEPDDDIYDIWVEQKTVHANDISQEPVDETAKSEPEPRLCCQEYETCTMPCTPRGRHLAKREWVGLTEDDLSVCDEDGVLLARYWEAKLKEKNVS